MRILVSGHYGAGNLGDEVISLALSRICSNMLGGVSEIRILSHSPSNTSRLTGEKAIRHPSVEAELWENLRDLRETVEWCDLVMVGGGGILQDEFTAETIPRYFLPAALAIWYGKPFTIQSVGVGRLIGGFSRRLCRKLCQNATRVSVRDERSRSRLESLGITDVHLAPDPAVCVDFEELFDGPEPSRDELGTVSGQQLLGVALRGFYHRAGNGNNGTVDLSGEQVNLIVSQIKEVVERLGMVPVFMSASRAMDTDINRHVARKVGGDAVIIDDTSPAGWFRFLANVDLLVSMPLHPAILACSAGTPVVAIEYADKVRSQMEVWGLGAYVVGMNRLDRLAPRVAEISKHKVAIASQQEDRKWELRNLSIENVRQDVAVSSRSEEKPRKTFTSVLMLNFITGYLLSSASDITPLSAPWT